MIIRGVDSDGDWVYGKGKNDYKRNLDAIKQNVETRLLSWKNDCFFALDEGVDYNNYLDIGTKDFLDRDVKRVILLSEGVMRIDEFESEITDRDYESESTILTIFGTTTIII